MSLTSVEVEEVDWSEQYEYFYEEEDFVYKLEDYKPNYDCIYCNKFFTNKRDSFLHEDNCKESPYCNICYQYGHNQKNCFS